MRETLSERCSQQLRCSVKFSVNGLTRERGERGFFCSGGAAFMPPPQSAALPLGLVGLGQDTALILIPYQCTVQKMLCFALFEWKHSALWLDETESLSSELVFFHKALSEWHQSQTTNFLCSEYNRVAAWCGSRKQIEVTGVAVSTLVIFNFQRHQPGMVYV